MPERTAAVPPESALQLGGQQQPRLLPVLQRGEMTLAEFTAFFRKQYDGFVSTVKENNVKFD